MCLSLELLVGWIQIFLDSTWRVWWQLPPSDEQRIPRINVNIFDGPTAQADTAVDRTPVNMWRTQ